MTGRPSPDRNQRGAVLPSPVVLLSIVAVVVAAIAFVVTRDAEPREREITTSAASEESSAPETTGGSDAAEPRESAEPQEPKKTKKPVERSEHGVVVFNNTSISGLASEVLAQVAEIGWSAVAADNWYGTISATTVYFPPGMRDAAQKLALDLGVQRIIPADAGMSDTNLTVILTGALE